MLYCPHCRRTYSLGDIVLWMWPRICISCGNHRLLRWDMARLNEFIYGGRTCPSAPLPR